MANEHIESKLKKLTKDELIILSRMLGIKTGFSFFQKESDLVNGILRKDKSDIEKRLNLISVLKASDPDWLRRTFEFELGIRKETSAEKASEILSQENVKTIKKFAGKVEYEGIVTKIFPKGLSLSIIIGCLATLILSFCAAFSLIAAAVSIFALGFVLFTAAYASPLGIRKRITIEHWKIISIAISVGIILLLLYTLYIKYPEFERDDFIKDWAGNVATIMGFMFGAVLYLCERAKLENWWRKHSGKVMVSIIAMVFLSICYVQFFIIAGNVVYKDVTDKVRKSKIILLKGSSFLSDFLCYKGNSLKNESDRLYKWLIKDNKLCETETDDDGNFSFRVFSFSKKYLEFEVNGRKIEYEYRKFKPGLLGDKKIELSTLKKPLEGNWICDIYRKDGTCKKVPLTINYLNDNKISIKSTDENEYQHFGYKFDKNNKEFSFDATNYQFIRNEDSDKKITIRINDIFNKIDIEISGYDDCSISKQDKTDKSCSFSCERIN